MPNQQNQKKHVRGPGSVRDELGMQSVVSVGIVICSDVRILHTYLGY